MVNQMHIIQVEETDSTNRYLRDYKGDEDKVLVRARHQTAGRGQGGNRWEDSAGDNLLFSIRVQPADLSVRHAFVLAMAEALALKAALDGYAEDIVLKWPNDVYWHDRKLSGTLIDTSVSKGQIRRMILGTGINVNQKRFCSDAPNPVSLCHIVGHDVDTDDLLRQILDAFDIYYNKVEVGDHGGIIGEYHAALYRRCGFYSYRDAGGGFDARLVRVGSDGRLTLCDTCGVERSYGFKEVEFII